MDELFEKIRQLISKKMKIDYTLIREHSNFNDDLGIDSIDSVELIMAIEKEFGVDIPDDEIDEFQTVADLIAYIRKEKNLQENI
jgi:acyl carrier protein